MQRLSGFGGTEDDVIEQSVFEEGEAAFIEIFASDVGFSNDPDCGDWQPG